MRDSKPILARVPVLEKEAADAKAEVERLTKEAADAADVEQSRSSKLASSTADTLKQLGLIATDGDHAKFATDLAEPEKAHNLIRYLGKKLAAAEAQAAVKPMGNPDHNGAKPKTAEDGESADDRFASRVRAAAGA